MSAPLRGNIEILKTSVPIIAELTKVGIQLMGLKARHLKLWPESGISTLA